MRFQTKIAACMMVFLALAFGIGGNLLIGFSFYDNLTHQKTSSADSYQMILNILGVANQINNKSFYENAPELLEQLDSNGGGAWKALRLSAEDRILYKSNSYTEYMRSVLEKEAEGFLLTVFETEDYHFLQISGKIKEQGMDFYLEVLYDISSIYEFRGNLQNIYRQIFFVIMVVGLFLSWILAGIVTRPVRKLSLTARRIARGRFSERAHIKNEDEIGELAKDINRMTDELERHIGELQLAMERQEAFMGSFAHELKTPMTAVIGYADLLRSLDMPEKKRRECANYIFHEGKRLETLSLKLLDLLLIKRQPPTLVLYQPGKVVKDIQNTLDLILEKRNIKLHVNCEEGSCLLEPSLVKAMLVNLVDNAAKSMDNGGNIYIRVSMIETGCEICVVDEGRGIPPEERERITEAFYRVDKSRSRAQGGVGLGLALCKEIVDLHNGTMTFMENKPQGSCVRVCLKGGELV